MILQALILQAPTCVRCGEFFDRDEDAVALFDDSGFVHRDCIPPVPGIEAYSALECRLALALGEVNFWATTDQAGLVLRMAAISERLQHLAAISR